MAQYQTGISINVEIYKRAKEYAISLRPPCTFSALVEIALEDFLAAQEQSIEKEGETVNEPSKVEFIQAA